MAVLRQAEPFFFCIMLVLRSYDLSAMEFQMQLSEVYEGVNFEMNDD